jgi:multidrug efflux pump subunit AcrA (membrane-fusion protein)
VLVIALAPVRPVHVAGGIKVDDQVPGPGQQRAGRHPRRWATIAVVLGLVAAAAVVISGAFSRDGGRRSLSDDGSATSLSLVTRRSLSEHAQVNGTLGYAGSYTVWSQASGTVTWLPKAGQVVREGQVLFRVDGEPVVLLYGAPAWRTLAAEVTGPDVAQLNHDLVALGYVDKADVDSTWDEFTWATRLGVERLQDHFGVDQTGGLDLGDVVFLPTAARVTALRTSLGAPATGPVLHATSTMPTVRVALQAGMQTDVRARDRVTITLPDGSTTPGRITSVGQVATIPRRDASSGSDGSTPTVPVDIRLTHQKAAGGLDQAPVEVTITHRTVRDVLAVKVTALLARTGGGYAVEVADGTTHHLVPVRPGLFDDVAGMVQVSGHGLRTGEHVVVPGNE